MKLPITFEGLIKEANQLQLYQKLIFQLNKDFQLANIDVSFHEDILPESLRVILQETVFNLIQNKFMEYLNLLYIIDVSEDDIKRLEEADILRLSEAVSFLILRREWQKVWFKNYY
ncbi:hypothetical protein KFZ70_03380 [Tamlana fucoidanivorans]|uniref:Uncharacterized protein n=1 Tax=Allotamlana fucoidanivorans TaxID=2583814 RepID=A0A5C4SK98_9FLAO|nr:hypothetical protein [Tamlana fucoidanivorans]TNJ44263.1 hypothetical protein FGF67_09540 [Tamlana fucoidanivorans]